MLLLLTAFGYLANLTSVCGLISWSIIGLTHLRFRAGMKAQGHNDDMLPFKAFGGIFFSCYTLFWTILIIFFAGWATFLSGNWSPADFVTTYLPVPVFFILYAIGSHLYGGKFIKAEEMDFVTGLQTIIDNEVEEPAPQNAWEKFWQVVS